VDALRQLVAAAHGVAATTLPGSESEISPDDVINSVADVLDKSMILMKMAQLCVDEPQNPENKARLAQVKNGTMLLYVDERQNPENRARLSFYVFYL